jgi:hypothetical protein
VRGGAEATIELGVVDEVPPTQAWAVDTVVEALGTRQVVELETCLERRRIDEFLPKLADEACIGPGTSRGAVAAAAVYAADRLTDGKTVTQAAFAAAASEIVSTSKRSGQSGNSLRIPDITTVRSLGTKVVWVTTPTQRWSLSRAVSVKKEVTVVRVRFYRLVPL